MIPGTQTYYVNSEADLNCPINFEKMEKPVETKCKHIFEDANIAKWINIKHDCPMCRTPLNERDIKPVVLVYRPEVKSPAERINAAALPALPSSALPTFAKALSAVEIARSIDDQRNDAREASVRRIEASHSAERPKHKILQKMRNGRNRAPNHKVTK